jgi:hypothetical protein
MERDLKAADEAKLAEVLTLTDACRSAAARWEEDYGAISRVV